VVVLGAGAWWGAGGSSPEGQLDAVWAAPIAKGSADAPVVLVEYADFQCDVCAIMAKQITPQLIEEFVSAGLVRMEYRHFVHKGQESLWAGMAAECANEQGLFWAYHDVLFDAQRVQPDTGAFTTARLKSFARQLNLDGAAFDDCLASGRYLSKLRANTDEARARGATGTPTIFVNDTRLGGLPPLSVLRELIQQELASSTNQD